MNADRFRSRTPRARVARGPAGHRLRAFIIAIWAAAVWFWQIQPYVLPAPSLIVQTLVTDRSLLLQSLLVTLVTTVEGFVLAALGGIILAVLFDLSRLVEYSLYPYAVILQVTPIDCGRAAAAHLLPQPHGGAGLRLDRGVLSGAGQYHAGLRSVDRNLADLFALYGASRAPDDVEPQTPRGAALHPRRFAHRRRPVADRRGGRRDRGGFGRRRLGPRLPHRRSAATASTSRACSRRCCCSAWRAS